MTKQKADALNKLRDLVDAVGSELNGLIVDGEFSDTSSFVTGVRYGLQYCIEEIRDEELDQ